MSHSALWWSFPNFSQILTKGWLTGQLCDKHRKWFTKQQKKMLQKQDKPSVQTCLINCFVTKRKKACLKVLPNLEIKVKIRCSVLHKVQPKLTSICSKRILNRKKVRSNLLRSSRLQFRCKNQNKNLKVSKPQVQCLVAKINTRNFSRMVKTWAVSRTMI